MNRFTTMEAPIVAALSSNVDSIADVRPALEVAPVG
jgi:hypothetical protein